jgi:hypothetical protein
MGVLHVAPANPPGQVQILRHEGNSFGMDCTLVGVFEHPGKVRLRGLLQSKNSRALPPKHLTWPCETVLGDRPDQPGERQLPNQQISALLVFPDLHERPGARTVASLLTGLTLH